MTNNKTNNNRKTIPFVHVRQIETGIAGEDFRSSQKARDQKVYTFYKSGELKSDYINAVKSNSPILNRFLPFSLAVNVVKPQEIEKQLKTFELLEYGFLCFSHKSRTLMPKMMGLKHIEDRLQSIKACWRQGTLNAGSIFACKEDLVDYLTCEFFFLDLWNFVPKVYSKYWARSNKFYAPDGSLQSLTREEFESCKKAGLGE